MALSLNLNGVSTSACEEALAALLGKDAPGLLASTITRLTKVRANSACRQTENNVRTHGGQLNRSITNNGSGGRHP